MEIAFGKKTVDAQGAGHAHRQLDRAHAVFDVLGIVFELGQGGVIRQLSAVGVVKEAVALQNVPIAFDKRAGQKGSVLQAGRSRAEPGSKLLGDSLSG